MLKKLFKRHFFLWLTALLFVVSACTTVYMLQKSESLLAWNERATGWALVQLVMLQQDYVNTLQQYQHGEDVYEQILTTYDLTWAAYQTLIEGTDEYKFSGEFERVSQLTEFFRTFEAADPLEVELSGEILAMALENNSRSHDYAMELLNYEFQAFSMQRHERDFYLVQLNKVIVMSLFGLSFSGAIFLFSLLRERRRMTYMAYHDSLTKLMNRVALQERISELQNEKIRFCILLIDIDGFKAVNDQFGHDIGDQLLIYIAHEMSGVCHEPNFIGRLGGDEFALVCFNQQALDQIVRQLLNITRGKITIEDCLCDVGLSIGASHSRTNSESWVEVLKNADVAMYKAKEKGGNQYQLYDPL